jgi:hypothetical protein
MSDNIFKTHFTKLLNEDIEENQAQDFDNEEASQEAFDKTLESDTNPEDFDVNPNSFKSINRANIEEAKKWIQILNDFSELINSVDNTDSLNHFLNRVDREGSAFRGIVRSQGKRVTGMAEDASAMAEVLGSHVVGSDRKERELLQQFPNLQK